MTKSPTPEEALKIVKYCKKLCDTSTYLEIEFFKKLQAHTENYDGDFKKSNLTPMENKND